MLSPDQLDHFYRKGYIVVKDAVCEKNIHAINTQIDRWVHESRNYESNYGKLIDGQPRFDLEPGHSKMTPKLRRITNPIEISDEVKHVLLGNSITQYLTRILGSNVKFDHCKINAKHPGMVSEIQYHQDHIFEPQTNDSVVVTLLMLNDATKENGCLKIVPGSHRFRYSHFKNGAFTGTIDPAYHADFDQKAVAIEAPAGSLCIMHTWAVHGSGANVSTTPRRILITEYKSANAFPLTRHKLPSRYMDAVVCGEDVDKPRHRKQRDFDIPEYYEGDSLFDLQENAQDEDQKINTGGAAG